MCPEGHLLRGGTPGPRGDTCARKDNCAWGGTPSRGHLHQEVHLCLGGTPVLEGTPAPWRTSAPRGHLRQEGHLCLEGHLPQGGTPAPRGYTCARKDTSAWGVGEDTVKGTPAPGRTLCLWGHMCQGDTCAWGGHMCRGGHLRRGDTCTEDTRTSRIHHGVRNGLPALQVPVRPHPTRPRGSQRQGEQG